MSAEPPYVGETLAWCNERRVERGKKPLKKLPKGERGDGASCPCGKATGLWVGQDIYKTAIYSPTLGHIPRPVHDFVVAFDDGELPQYEIGGAA